MGLYLIVKVEVMIIITSYNSNSRVIIVTVVLHIMGLYLIVKKL
jgi:hypothetical protein